MNRSYNCSLPISTEDVVFATLYSLIVFFGVLGNVIVITIVRNTPSMHTPTNYLLLNLAVGDLIALLFCPGFYEFALKNVQLGATVGDVMCKLFFGNATVCVAWDASISTLCVIAIERFIGIVKPFNNDWALTKKRVSLAIVIIWVMAVSSSFPDILLTKHTNNRSRLHFCSPCARPWTVLNQSFLVKTYTVTHSVVLIVFPSAIILFCYISVFSAFKWGPGDSLPDKMSRKETQKLLKLLVSLAVAFCVLCLPFAGFFFLSLRTMWGTLNRRHLCYSRSELFVFLPFPILLLIHCYTLLKARITDLPWRNIHVVEITQTLVETKVYAWLTGAGNINVITLWKRKEEFNVTPVRMHVPSLFTQTQPNYSCRLILVSKWEPCNFFAS